MDTKRDDVIIHFLTAPPSRRDVLPALAGVGFVAFLGWSHGASNVAAKKKRKKKHQQRRNDPAPSSPAPSSQPPPSPPQDFTAEASRGWCRCDPVVMIGDILANIFLWAPPGAPTKVTGPNEIVVTIPNTLPGLVVAETRGFGKGEKVTIVQSPTLHVTHNLIQVTIEAFVPADDDQMPVGVEFAPRTGDLLFPDIMQGFANGWIVLKMSAL